MGGGTRVRLLCGWRASRGDAGNHVTGGTAGWEGSVWGRMGEHGKGGAKVKLRAALTCCFCPNHGFAHVDGDGANFNSPGE